MRLIAFILGLTAFFSIDHSQAQTSKTQLLQQFQWQARPILIFADSPESTNYNNQIKNLTNKQSALKDRDVIILSIIDDNVTDLDGKTYDISAKAMRHKYKIQSGFHLILIGKDGRPKLQRKSVTSVNELKDLIDTMPMRQSEMRR